VLYKRVGEAVPIGGHIDHKPGRDRGVQNVQQHLVADVRSGRQKARIEVAAYHRPRRQNRHCLRAEMSHPPTDHLTHTDRESVVAKIAARPPSPCLILEDRAGFDQMPQELTDEERVSIGLSAEGVAQHQLLIAQLVTCSSLHQGQQLQIPQSSKAEAGHPRLAVQPGQPVCERTVRRDIGLPERNYGHDREGVVGSNQVA